MKFKAYSLECPPPRKSLEKGKQFIGSINSPWAKDQMLHRLGGADKLLSYQVVSMTTIPRDMCNSINYNFKQHSNNVLVKV